MCANGRRVVQRRGKARTPRPAQRSATALYNAFAGAPVSSPTTPAATRARAPAETSRRTASTAASGTPDGAGAPPMTSTTSPRGAARA